MAFELKVDFCLQVLYSVNYSLYNVISLLHVFIVYNTGKLNVKLYLTVSLGCYEINIQSNVQSNFA